MAKRHSLEFGRKGTEGITGEETDEKIYKYSDDEAILDKFDKDVKEINKLLDEINTKKDPKSDKEAFLDDLKRTLKGDENVLEYDVEDLKEDETSKEVQKLKEDIGKIFE